MASLRSGHRFILKKHPRRLPLRGPLKTGSQLAVRRFTLSKISLADSRGAANPWLQPHEKAFSMSSITAPAGYSRAQVILHWLIAALILFQLLVHDGMEDAWRALRQGGEEGGNPLPHIIVGSAILILAAARLVIRIRHGAPPHPAGQPAALGLLANIVHWGIYALLFAIPISGLVAWFGGVEPAAMAHAGPLRLLLIGLVLLHIAGALVQQFVLRSGVLMRMFRPES